MALWHTRSNPAASGRKLTGVANVLSITLTRPWARANATTSGRRGTRTNGFEIVSSKITLVSGVTAAAQVSGRWVSTKLQLHPRSSACSVRKSWVPPYRQSLARMWSPARSRLSSVVVIAAIPEAVATAASPRSSAASRACKSSCDGVVLRRW